MNEQQGERGPTGDTGNTGRQGERGLVGLTGGDGDIGLIGERGPTGDHGQHGDPGEPGRRGEHGQDGARGPTGINGLDAPPVAMGVKVLGGVTAVMFLTAIILALVVTLTSQARDTRTIDKLNAQLVARATEHEAISSNQETEQVVEDCRDLYDRDVSDAQALYLIEFGDFATTPEDGRLAAGERLTAAKVAYQEAIDAFNVYAATNPAPIECPYPDA